MRLFFAIDLPRDERERLASLLPDAAPGIRRVPADRMHLTLRFVGHVSDETRDGLARALSAMPFEAGLIRLRGVGTFPARGRPRVLWVGVEVDAATRALHTSVETLCREAGIEEDPSGWSPHVTLGRFKKGRPPWLEDFLESNDTLESGLIAVNGVVLYDSVPAPPSVRYEAVAVRRAD